MRNLVVYYFIILVPLLLLITALKSGLISDSVFVVLLLIYVVYRQFTDALRLQAKGVIKATWKIIVNPFLQVQYFKELYWFSK